MDNSERSKSAFLLYETPKAPVQIYLPRNYQFSPK